MKEYPVTYENGSRVPNPTKYILLDDADAKVLSDRGAEIGSLQGRGHNVAVIDGHRTGGKRKIPSSILQYIYGFSRRRRFSGFANNDYTRAAYLPGNLSGVSVKTPGRVDAVGSIPPTVTKVTPKNHGNALTVYVDGVEVAGNPADIAEVIKNLSKNDVTA